ncbi:MAG: aldo/keto reductase [Phycisphaerae bacterium]|nr:aldo/keto reductase [Phycisphaerae bacterium]
MIYTNYGRTGAKVSAVGFGGMRFDESKSNEENAELLLYAQSKGINYFDTAPTYCSDTSEDIFGIAMKQMRDTRDAYHVTSKGMPVEFNTADKARKAVEKSLKRLNLERIDFYHVWCIRRMDQYELAMKKGGQYQGLMKCKKEGLIGNIVISTHLPGPQIKQILAKDEFEGILLGVNVLNFPYRWEGIQAAHDAGLGVVAMNPLSGGLIPQHQDQLAFLAGPNETPTEAALRFCISAPQITVTLVGFTTREQIDTACRIADEARPFSDADIERVRTHVSENMNALCTGCGYCLKSCPQNIPIANYMQVYNEKLFLNLDDKAMLAKMKFNHDWGLLVDRCADSGYCVECGACENVCTQHLNIMERLKEIAAWENTLMCG